MQASEKANVGSYGKWPKRTYSVPSEVKKAAKKGIELRDEFGTKAYRARTKVGMKRAKQLASGSPKVTFHDLVVMNNWFARHEQDIKGVKFDKSDPTNGWISWLLWGGTPAKKWVEKELRRDLDKWWDWAKDKIDSVDMRKLKRDKRSQSLSKELDFFFRANQRGGRVREEEIQAQAAQPPKPSSAKQAPASVAFSPYGKGNGYLVKTAIVPAYPGAPKPEITIASTEDVAKLCEFMTKSDREHLVVLCLDFDCRLLAIQETAIGFPDMVEQDWPEMLRPVVLSAAKGAILVHNHPSGATGRTRASHPSSDDKKFAKSASVVFRGIGVELVDFVIVAENSYTSVLKN